jgi:hypothetical protein
MDHHDFVKALDEKRIAWGVWHVGRAVEAVWGRRQRWAYRAALAAVALPVLTFAAYCIMTSRYTALIWAALGLLALRTARADVSCAGGFLWIVSALVGAAMAWFHGPLQLVGGLLPLAGYIGSSVLMGVTLQVMEAELRASRDAYGRLNASGALFTVATHAS